MFLDKNSETKWLVKSENKVLGPFSYDQVNDLIRKKQLSLIDEIRDPENRWLYIRENPEFKDIVEEIRKETEVRGEATKTYQSISKTVDENLLKTKTDFNQFSSIELEAQEVKLLQEIPIEPDESSPKNLATIPVDIKSYGSKSDQSIEQKLNLHNKRGLLVITAAVVVIVTLILGYSYNQRISLAKRNEDLVQQVRRLKYLGAYQKAAEQFSQLPDELKKKLFPEILEIYPLLESSGYFVRDEFSLLKENPALTSEQKANLELINMKSAITNNKLSEAQEYLVKAQSLQPTSSLVKENEALMNLKLGKFKDSYENFDKMLKEDNNGRYLLGMTLSFFGMSTVDKDLYVRDLSSKIERYTAIYYDFRKELLAAQMSLSQKLGDDLLYKISKDKFFNTPCKLADEFVVPLLILSDMYSWSKLGELKNAAQKNLIDDDAVLFHLHDLLESNQLSSAAEFVNTNFEKIKKPELKAQMNLLLFNAQKRNNEAVHLQKALTLNQNADLNHFLLAKNKIELNPADNISEHLAYFTSRKNDFYQEWLQLQQLLANNSKNELKSYLNSHFVTISNFKPVLTAKSLLN